ncbi:hypothetical protein L3Q82_020866, partial [Scortum barcoo]
PKDLQGVSLLCLTETWLTASIPDANVELPDFSTVSCGTETQKPAGSAKEEDSHYLYDALLANNKPWITSDIKGLLNQKKKAFKDGDTQELKQIQKELRVQLREAKEQYRKKIEQRMQNNNMRDGVGGDEDHHWLQLQERCPH